MEKNALEEESDPEAVLVLEIFPCCRVEFSEGSALSHGTQSQRRVLVSRAALFVQVCQALYGAGVAFFRSDQQKHSRLRAALWHAVALDIHFGQSRRSRTVSCLHHCPQLIGRQRSFWQPRLIPRLHPRSCGWPRRRSRFFLSADRKNVGRRTARIGVRNRWRTGYWRRLRRQFRSGFRRETMFAKVL
jgi:hypothetical protein